MGELFFNEPLGYTGAMRCHICKAENLERFLSLGHQPPSDAFLKYEEL